MKRNGAPFLWNGCAVLAEYANRAQKILILFTPNKTPWDEIGLELDNTIRVDTDYTFYNELTIKTLKKWIARVIGYVVDW